MNEEVKMVAIELLDAAPDNPRRDVTAGIDELVTSVKEVGVQVPILIRPKDGGRFEVVAGHRRTAAASRAGLTEVPAISREMDDRERLSVMLVENLQRQDLDPVEEASGYFRLVGVGMTQAEMARRVGRSKKHVSERIKLLEAGPVVLAWLKKGAIDVEDALGLARATPEERAEWGERFRKGMWSNMDAEWLLRTVRRDAEQAAKREAVLAKLPDGTEVATEPRREWRDAGLLPIEDVGLSLAAARKEGLHLVAHIDDYNRLTWLTDQPKEARKLARANVPPEKAARDEEARAERRESRERAQARQEAMQAAVGARLPALSELVSLAADALVASMTIDDCRVALGLLGIEAPAKNGQSYTDWRRLFSQFAAKDPRRAVRAGHAALAETRSYDSEWGKARVKLLAEGGYDAKRDPDLKARR